MSTHASLSPSASHRWLACPPSAKLCAYLVEKALGREVSDLTENLDYYNQEMQDCADGYATFVMEEYGKARQTCTDADVLVEQKIDFYCWIKHGTGTADCINLSDGTAEVLDFKYGLGVLVSVDPEEHSGNPQLMCYCLGVREMFDGIYDIDTLKMVICQPRRENVSTYTMSKAELLRWAEEILTPIALLAMEGKDGFKAGDHSSSARVKATCREHA